MSDRAPEDGTEDVRVNTDLSFEELVDLVIHADDEKSADVVDPDLNH
ncbi:MAG TPA: hypothetical protein VHK88_06965 [Aquihabitans sp.]|nr:hypothetical protein [Aquihabitans sp.]